MTSVSRAFHGIDLVLEIYQGRLCTLQVSDHFSQGILVRGGVIVTTETLSLDLIDLAREQGLDVGAHRRSERR